MEPNHYAPPQAPLEGPPPPAAGEVIPFEDPGTYPGLGQRILETFRWIFFDRERAGAAFRGASTLGRPILFLCAVSYLPTVIPGILGLLYPRMPFWMAWMKVPQPEAPQGVFLWIQASALVLFAPVSMLIGGMIIGLVFHAGLWMARGTKGGFGLASTLRAVCYTAGALSWILFPFSLGQTLPGLAGQVFQVLAILLPMFLWTTYQGLLLARTHQIETWRGVLGAWIPSFLFLGCMGSCIAGIFFLAGDSFREALQRGGAAMVSMLDSR